MDTMQFAILASATTRSAATSALRNAPEVPHAVRSRARHTSRGRFAIAAALRRAAGAIEPAQCSPAC
jgi:hypothetical protein